MTLAALAGWQEAVIVFLLFTNAVSTSVAALAVMLMVRQRPPEAVPAWLAKSRFLNPWAAPPPANPQP